MSIRNMLMSSRGRFANGVGLLLRRRPAVVEDIHGPWKALLAGRGSHLLGNRRRRSHLATLVG